MDNKDILYTLDMMDNMDKLCYNIDTDNKLIKEQTNMKNTEDVAKQIRNEYYREWRKKNPEKNKEYVERYWTKKAKEHVESQKQK